MQETLYKTLTPEADISEYWEMAIRDISGRKPRVYEFVVKHGWWDEAEKKAKQDFTAICPEEGLWSEEAEEMYNKQKAHCVQNGFIYSFSVNPFGQGPHLVEL